MANKVDKNKIEKNSFEESLKELKEYAEKIKSNDITLDEAIEFYEKGMTSYERCSKILKEATQKIETYNEDEREL